MALVLTITGATFSFGYVIPHYIYPEVQEAENLPTVENAENASEASSQYFGEGTQPPETTEGPEERGTGPSQGSETVVVPDISQFLAAAAIFGALGIGGGIGFGYLIARYRVFGGVSSPPPKKLPKLGVEEQVLGYIKSRREFTMPELVRATDGAEAEVWGVVRRLIKRGVVRPTEKTRLVIAGLGRREESRVFVYVSETD